MDLRLVYEGLNIKGCYEVHEGYLYTINNAINKPIVIYRKNNSWVPEE